MEEFLPSKQVVAGSSPVIHSIRLEISSLGEGGGIEPGYKTHGLYGGDLGPPEKLRTESASLRKKNVRTALLAYIGVWLSGDSNGLQNRRCTTHGGSSPPAPAIH